jgi:hypothetical protein
VLAQSKRESLAIYYARAASLLKRLEAKDIRRYFIYSVDPNIKDIDRFVLKRVIKAFFNSIRNKDIKERALRASKLTLPCL